MPHNPFSTDALSRRGFLTRVAAVPIAIGAASACANSTPASSGGTAASAPAAAPAASATGIPIAVYKDPNCGCCEKWVAHMAANGFSPTVTNLSDMVATKTKYGVKADLQSCHTGIVNGLVIEGHVPASDVARFIAAPPAGVIGLTIPGMPASAPGMDLTPFQPYTVLAFDAAGKTSVFATHEKVSA